MTFIKFSQCELQNHIKNYFCKKIHFRCTTGSEFASDDNKSNHFYEQQKSYITVFGFYYKAGILPVQIQQ